MAKWSVKKVFIFLSFFVSCSVFLNGCGIPLPGTEVSSFSTFSSYPSDTALSSPSPFNERAGIFPNAVAREEKGGWIYLQISGNAYARGYQYGYELSREIWKNIEIQDVSLEHETGQGFSFFREKAVEFYGEMVPPEYREEMRGIADGASQSGLEISYEDILCLNSLIDLSSWWQVKFSSSASLLNHCSAFIATGDWTTDGKIVMAHNTWGDYLSFSPWNIILDIVPEKGHRIVMQTAPGLIWSGADFFLTDAGLVGCETTFFNFQHFDEKGMPAFLRARRAMQYAGSIDDFVSLMKEGNNGGYPNSWLLGDIKTNEIARFEQGLIYASLSLSSNGYFAGYNAPEDPGIQSECGGWSANDPSNFSGARKVRFQELMEEHKGKIDAGTAKVILADHYDTWLGRENPSARTICGHYIYHQAPGGAVDGKVITSDLASRMQFWAIWGAPCQTPFVAEKAIEENPQFLWLKGYLEDLPAGSWNLF
ncbi:MAG: C45 family autoproteolytic acyltransferase/hydrolase [bacterium]